MSLNGDPAIARLRDMIDQRLNELADVALKSVDYESGSWAYKQADINGARRTLKQIKDLITP